MVLKKTCWLAAIFPCRIGAMLGLTNRGIVAPDAFVRFGFFFGAAFQIHDDVLNLRGGDIYGKESCGDLWEAKCTLMLIDVAQTLKGHDRKRYDRFMAQSREERSHEDVAWLLDIMTQTGAIERAYVFSQSLAGAAVHEFSRAFKDIPENRDTIFLRDLITWTFRRDH